MEEGKREVLNAFVGMTNIIDEEKIDEVMIATFANILDILSDYCGPYSKFAILTNPNNPTAQPTFTKDGLNIIRAIEFISPMERHVKDTMAYISQRVERASGDGTTSTMIMVAAIMKSLKEDLKSMGVISYNDFVFAYKLFSKLLLEILEEKKIDFESIEELHNIALAQALTSSHGNLVLAEKVAELYSSTPKQAWEYVLFERERKETANDIDVKVDDSDYSCKARIFDNKFYNTPHGDAFNLEGATLILGLSQLITNSLEYVNIKRTLKECIEQKKKVVVIAPDGADPKVRAEIDELVGTKGNPEVGIFLLEISSPKINDHVGMLTTFGVEGIDENNLAIFSDVNVEYKDGRLFVSNIVERTENMLHPDYMDETSRLYKYLHAIEEFVEEYKNSTATNHNTDLLIKEARRIYNAILLQKQGRIVIGGAAYDNEALVDIVEDTMKATRATLLSGATLGLYQTLKSAIGTLLEHDYDKYNTLIKSIAKAFDLGVDTLSECTSKHLDKSTADSLMKCLHEDGYVYNVAIKCKRTLEDCRKDDSCRAVVLQPFNVDKELIKRFGEVALKFMFTNRVIIPGGVVIDQEKGD